MTSGHFFEEFPEKYYKRKGYDKIRKGRMYFKILSCKIYYQGVRILSDRWDWWNKDKDTAKKPESWQPLTEEEEQRVVVVPVVRRLRLNPEAWRGSRTMDPEKLAENVQAARAREAEELRERAKRSAATIVSSRRREQKVTVKIEVTDVKVRKATDKREEMSRAVGGRRYTREDILGTLNVMVNYFGKMPSTTQILDYAAKNGGVPSMTIFAKHLGPKDTWRAQLDEYVASFSEVGEPNRAMESPEVGSNGSQGQAVPTLSGVAGSNTVDGAAGLPEAKLGETDEECSGTTMNGDAGSDESERRAEALAVKPDELTEVDSDLLLSIATNFRVRMDGKEYTFVAQFEDLRPIAVEDIREESEAK